MKEDRLVYCKSRSSNCIFQSIHFSSLSLSLISPQTSFSAQPHHQAVNLSAHKFTFHSFSLLFHGSKSVFRFSHHENREREGERKTQKEWMYRVKDMRKFALKVHIPLDIIPHGFLYKEWRTEGSMNEV